ncbi:uncharacterized protein phrf1 isoform X2 [Stigmatopora argus]
MDDDDSPDELIKRSNHRKRMEPWDISDSDDDPDESEDGESDSGDEEEGDVEGEENEEDDDEDDEEEDAALAEDDVFGETSAAPADVSSDEDAEKCPICLNSFSNQPVATPENCEHYFCLDCILAWSKNANSCPVDRIAFNSICLRKSYGGKVQKIITVQKPAKEVEEEVTVGLDLELTNCEVCQGSDREDRLLLCDGCDAGYHMECLTPPLDTVPVEEWFCPECVSNNIDSGSVEELNRTQSIPSTAQPTTSRAQSRAAGLTRAIARTQHSERVRANVNRHRITQARTSQHAPAYQIQSTWLDETINAVVAGLNTAIYIRDLTPRAPTRRRRTTGTRRKVTKKKPLSAKGKKSRSTKRRRKRKGKRSKSKTTWVGKKVATPRSRIANSLGLSKDKNNCSLPTVCRPTEHTLSNMRADIGAASLSIYGDPSDLDPFIEREGDGQDDIVLSLLQAKRRGISHSAFRSHQPVARPVSTGMSRQGMDVSQIGGVVEAAPVPDLLGSILSGQNMLLMDSSDVVINRDGSLKASKTAAGFSTLKPDSRKGSNSEESNFQAETAVSPILEESSLSNHHNRPQPDDFHSNLSRPFSQGSSQVPSVHHIHPSHSPDLPPRGFQPPIKNRPSPSFGIQRTIAPTPCKKSDPSPFRKATLPSQSQPTKTPVKPTWVDVDILPKIPKLKRDAANVGNSGTSSSPSACNTNNNNPGIPETALMNFAGDRNGQQRVSQQSNTDRQPQNQGAGSSQGFSNSFSFSSFTVPPSTPTCNTSVSTSSSSSSSISFRINASGNSWQSRRLSLPTCPSSGSNIVDDRRKKVEAAKERQEHWDRQNLFGSRPDPGGRQNVNNAYDPSDPTMSDSSSSDDDESVDGSSRQFNSVPDLAFRQFLEQSKQQKLARVKTETRESEASHEFPRSAPVQTPSRVVSCASGVVRVRIESVKTERKIENRTAVSGIKIKIEPGLSDSGKDDILGKAVKSCSGLETPDTFSPVHHSLDYLQPKEESGISCKKFDSLGSASSFRIKVKEEIKPDTPPRRDLVQKNKTSTTAVPEKEQHSTSSSSEFDGDKTKEHLVTNQEKRQKKMDSDRERRSRERKAHSSSSSSSSPSSSSSSSPSRSPQRSSKKRKQRSSSDSRSSSKERSRRNKHEQTRREHTDDSENGRNRRDRTFGPPSSRFGDRSKDHRHGRSHSKSPATSPYRSRSRERRRERPHSRHEDLKPRLKDKSKPRSRSSSRERRETDASPKSLPETALLGFSSSKYDKITKNESKEEKMPEVKKEVSVSSLAAKVKKENDSADAVITTPEIEKEFKHLKKVKKEDQQSIDMFQYSPLTTSLLTSQEIKTDPSEGVVCQAIITENICEITQVKVEPVPSELPVTLSHTLESYQEPTNNFQPESKAPVDEANTIESETPLKQPDYDEDFSVDLLLDSIGFLKTERNEDINSYVKKEDIKQEVKPEAEQIPAACKSKIQGKRVTWNIQEPEAVQPDKAESKFALYKKKVKQEATYRPLSVPTTQDTSGPDSLSDLAKRDDAAQPTSSGCQAYLKKLHMQERAIEEVKLAIKPFYQKRDITKEEYKDILRKAVQKVCHSKSGEINPVKVGNLVKAYVDKYKHARKRQKSETEPTKTSDSN